PPAGHGMLLPGSESKNRATPAIQLDGTHASRAMRMPRPGNQGIITQAIRPSTVATGAAGSASTFAGTAYSGIDGFSRMSTGWQASCAASGTAMTSASAEGSHLESRAASG